jgi:Family of unknown function (DUF6331)
MSRKARELRLTFPAPLLGLIRACEVNCVAGCCSLGAFEFEWRHMAVFLDEQPPGTGWVVLDQIEELAEVVGNHRGRISSEMDDLNVWWDKTGECLELVRHWQREALTAARSRKVGYPLDPAWLHCHDGAVRALAVAIQKESTFDSLPILADALEDAGCQDQTLLAHCRRPHDHVPSCWVVEMLTQAEGADRRA